MLCNSLKIQVGFMGIKPQLLGSPCLVNVASHVHKKQVAIQSGSMVTTNKPMVIGPLWVGFILIH